MRILSTTLCAAALAAVLAWAPPARALEKDAQWGFEIRLGGYRPAFGSGLVGDTGQGEKAYYDLFYNRDKRPLMLGLEFDRYFTDLFGPLGVFFQVGHWKVSGRTRVCSENGSATDCTPELIWTSESGRDKTQLQIIPLSGGVVYRFDLLMRELNIPLMVSLKAGFDYFYWWEADEGSDLGSSFGVGNSGGTMGLHGAVAVALNLDWISTDGGQSEHVLFLDSYLFAELTGIWGTGFGDDQKFDMSDTQVVFGVSFDFD